MVDTDKALIGLGQHISGRTVVRCGSCPYFYGDSGYGISCRDELLDDLYELLEAQEARVLGLGELIGFDGAFFIEYNPSMISREANWAMLHYIDEKKVHIWRPRQVEHYAIAQYGVTWRCWTSRPTDAQREAEPWATL